jgi:SAM-dependent methyltransferase
MENVYSTETNNSSHPGGNPNFWQDEMVRKYDFQQSLLSEKKEEVLSNIVRIITYFSKKNGISVPSTLDIGCGPGTPETLSAYILKSVPNAEVTGIDSSKQMVEAAINNLSQSKRFIAQVGDFNSNDFWSGETNNLYDFIVSSSSLHYLSDFRREPFLKEIYDHLKSHGIFIAGIATCSENPDIYEMEQTFRTEYTYNKLPEDKKPKEFNQFRKNFEDIDKKANINWKSPTLWLSSITNSGYKSADIVWTSWVRSIFLGIK